MVGQLPDDFNEACYYEEAGGIVHQRLANLKSEPEGDGKAVDLIAYLPLSRRNLKAVPHGPGKPGHWGYPGEQPGPDVARQATAAKPAPAAPTANPTTK